jgi:DNA polymerase elongation subunit (family B)
LYVAADTQRGATYPFYVSRTITSPRRIINKTAHSKAPNAHGLPVAEAIFNPTGQTFIGEPVITLLDIEVAPLLGHAWGRYEQNIIEEERPWFMLSFSWKRLYEPRAKVMALPDFKGYRKDKTNDRELLKALWCILDESDIIVGQNIDRYDIRKINARFITHEIPPPLPYITVDTLKLARKFFMFDSNKLDDLGKQLGVGRKLKTHGKDTWLGAIRGDMKEWGNMRRYNAMDVELNERVFLKMLPWLLSKPNRRKPITAKGYA